MNFKNKIHISFDFDGVLSERFFVEFLKELFKSFPNCRERLNLFILTSRRNNEQVRLEWPHWSEERIVRYNNDVFAVAKELGIPSQNVLFTNWDRKVTFLKYQNNPNIPKYMTIHVDDNLEEVKAFQKETDTLALYFLDNDLQSVDEVFTTLSMFFKTLNVQI